jgi:uncharacterized protein YceK
MSRGLVVAVALALGLSATGCASVYTSINRVDDNTYYVTRVKNNQGTLFVCSPIGETAALRCTEVATTSP